MGKCKILFVNGHLNVGGVERSLVDLLRWLNYSKYEVDLLLLEEEGTYINQLPKEVNIIHRDIREAYGSFFLTIWKNFKKGSFGNIFFRFILFLSSFLGKKLFRLWNPLFKIAPFYDCAIAYRPGICADVVAYTVKSKGKICWWHHGECFYTDSQIVNTNKVWKIFNYIVTVSCACKEMLYNTFDYPYDRIKVIPNLIDIERISKMAGNDSPYDLDYSGTKIITVGRLSPEKHIIDIPQIASELIIKGFRHFRWFVVGDGNMRKQIEEEISKYDVERYVFLLGAKSNPYPYIKYADMLVHTSHVESQGITILEAMALKTPCVVVSSMGPKEYINKENGTIVDYSLKTIIEGIINMINRSDKTKMELQAYRTVKELYSPSIIIRSFDALIDL